MKRGHGTPEASKIGLKDTISGMPKNVLTNILDRLPIQEAVRTCVLSRDWRLNWTMLTQLIFDEKFFEFLLRTKREMLFYRRHLSIVLLHFKDAITKFVLYIPKEKYNVLEVEDINHWVFFLSTKGMKEFVLINMRKTPLKLPTYLFSCLKLKHLKLYNCRFHLVTSFHGFPYLLSFEFHKVRFESCKLGEFITLCPLLENLKIDRHNYADKVKPAEIAKLEHLKMLYLSLSMLDNIAITSQGICQLLGFLPNLQELDLDFQMCKFLVEAGARKKVSVALPCLKSLTLSELNLNNHVMVLCAFDLIRCSTNLQTLKITVDHEQHVSTPPLCSWEVNSGLTGKLQLRVVELEGIRDSEIEICLIKALLAYSSLLKKMVIKNNTAGMYDGCHGNCTFARKLLKLHRASPIAEIDLY